ncbi:MAG: tRNA (adenosine(37)-N6)-threonylcarbamoyltransferase complex ATPase subunit type 1 TsaE [Chloroflexi bacterium]|nr:tRNA (adenosine(37)-N6)-threonylcarbamoyltransferase complex ATPase subunit type 1 TsaE [Chloroflexota bacterium]
MNLPVSNELTIDVISHSIEETQRIGDRLGKLARAGDVFCLEGDLGSGKTCLTQGLGRGLGVAEAIHSPTFILANEHRSGRLPLYHLDVYRMRGADEALGIGLDDYVYGDGVCVIEWAEKIDKALPPERLWITFRHIDENQRGLSFHATGARYDELLKEFSATSH